MFLEGVPKEYITLLQVMAVLFELMIFMMVYLSLRRKENMTTQKLISRYMRYIIFIHLFLLALFIFIPILLKQLV